MIKFTNLNFKYMNSDKKCLENISLEIKKNECILFTGVSGCGKTSILRLINGLIPNFYYGELTGQVCIDDENITNMDIRDISRKVNSVFQNPKSQFFNAIVEDELAFKPENYNMNPKDIVKNIKDILEKYKLKDFQKRNLFTLSGGEKQRICCLTSETFPAEIIVLDEPSSNLDVDSIEKLREIITKWKKEGKTIIIAEHRLWYLMGLADRVYYMKEGKIERTFSGNEFEDIPYKALKEMGLRSNQNHKLKFYSRIGNITDNKANKYKNNNLIQIDYLNFRVKEKELLDIKNIFLPMNSIIGIVGLNGVGKSTFMNCFCGLEKKSKEVIKVAGIKMDKKQRLKKSYIVMQDVNHQLFTESVEEEMKVNLSAKYADGKYIDILKSLNLYHLLEKHPMSLSGGQKQRLAIATAMVSDRDIIFFDEPTSGLDYYHMQEVAKNMLELKKERKTIFIITHDYELIEECCEHILCFDNQSKRIIGNFSDEKITKLYLGEKHGS